MKGFKTKSIKILFVSILLFMGTISCNENPSENKSLAENLIKDVSEVIEDENKEPLEVDEPEVSEVLFCSDLELSGIKWSKSLSGLDVNLYSLAMNITGSYEGFSNFRNLTNNFDGQGVSLGIFQQNLGQGSLQPLLLKARSNHNSLFFQHFTSEQRNSIFNMLETWQGNNIAPLSLASVATVRGPASTKWNESNPLDIVVESDNSFFQTFAASNAKNAKSVDWAVGNLFLSNGKTFKSSWKNSLKNFAGDSRYVSLQVEAGRFLHTRAMSFMKQYDAKELRSYLFFFDIAVQNGGIYNSVKDDYFDYIEQNPGLSEYERMKALLEFRLTRVRKQYVEDVRSRKMTILDGVGVVHQNNRNLPEEYCIDDMTAKVRP